VKLEVFVREAVVGAAEDMDWQLSDPSELIIMA
jgi:predicted component of type VI protein secretion system